MNNNNNFYNGNQGLHQQATTSTTVAYQAPYDANQMQYGNMNHFQDFYNPNNFYNQGPYVLAPPLYPAHPNFGATVPHSQAHLGDNNGTGFVMPPVQNIHRMAKIVGGMDWEAEIKINQTSFDPNGYWDATGFHLYQQTQAHHAQCPQQVQQPLAQQGDQAPLSLSMPAPQQQGCHNHQAAVLPAAPQDPSIVPSNYSSIPILQCFVFSDNFFNASLPPFFNPSTTAPHPPINIKLSNMDLWKMFHTLGNEMSVNNGGKKIFPLLAYKVSGLIHGQRYKFVLRMERVESYAHSWNRFSRNFERDDTLDAGSSITTEVYSKVMTGQEFEEKGLGFEKVNLFNIGDPKKVADAKKKKKGPATKSQLRTALKRTNKLIEPRIRVNLGCRYRPVLSIYGVSNGVYIPRGEFRFEETIFMVVSEYRNPEVRDHKTVLSNSVGKETKAKAQQRLEERYGQSSRPDSGYSTGSNVSPPPTASMFLGAYGSLPSTSSAY